MKRALVFFGVLAVAFALVGLVRLVDGLRPLFGAAP